MAGHPLGHLGVGDRQPDGDAGHSRLPDLAFGPVAERALSASIAAAPAEIEALAGATLDRARAAVAALRGLGLDQSDIDRLADLGSTLLEGDDSHPALVDEALLAQLRSKVSGDRITAAATEFAAAHPEPAGLFDLGDPTDSAARDAGYDCLVNP